MKRVLVSLWIGLAASVALWTPSAPARAQDVAQDVAGAAAAGDVASETAALSAEVEDDRGFITRFLERNLSGAGRTVTIDGFQGALSSRATFTRMTIADADGVWLTLKDGAIQWNRAALFARRISIQELSAAEIDLPRMPQGEPAAPKAEAREFSLPTLPVAVEIAKIEAGRVRLGEPVIGEAADVAIDGSMTLEGGEGTAKLSIDRVDAKRGVFALDGAFSNDTRILKLDLTLDEDRHGLFANLVKLHDRPAVKAEIKGEGPLSDFAAQIRLATDGHDRVTGTVSAKAEPGPDGAPGNAFAVALAGDVASLLPPDNRAFFGARSELTARGWRGATGGMSLPELRIHTDALDLTGSATTTDKGAPEKLNVTLALGQDAGATVLPVRLPFGGGATDVRSGSLRISYDATQGDGWSLTGRIGDLTQNGSRIGAMTLEGSGTVRLTGSALEEVLGQIRLGAAEIALADPKMSAALGDRIGLKSDFSFAPENALELGGLTLTGTDYGLTGDLRADGLGSGITVSGTLHASYDDLTRLSGLAGRKLSGRAEADVSGLYTVLTRGFDAEARIAGQDLTIDDPRIDRLMGGASQITLSARRDENGIELRDLTVDARRIAAHAEGTVATADADLHATVSLKSLTDADPTLAGAMQAEAALSGPAGARRLAVNGTAQDLILGIKELDGALKGKTDLAVIAQQKGRDYDVQALRLANPQMTVTGKGLVGPEALDATLDVAVPELAVLGRGWSGGLTATARAQREADGTRVVDVTGTGTELRLGQADVDGALTGQTDFTLSAREKDGVVDIGALDLRNAQMTAAVQGVYGKDVTDLTAKAQVLSLASFGRGWRGTMTIDGSIRDDGQGSRAYDLTGTGKDIAFGQAQVDGALSGPSTLRLRATQTGDAFDIAEARLVSDQTEVTAQGLYAKGRTDMTARARLRNLASLGLGWRGAVEADAVFRDDGTGARRLTVDGIGRDLSFGAGGATDAALTGETRLTVRGNERDGLFTIEQATVANPRLTAEAKGTVVPGGTDVTARIDAPSLAFLGRGIRGGLTASGRLLEKGGARHLSANGSANGLAIGNEKVDRLLAGQTDFDVAARQSPRGITLERVIARNGQLNIRADGDLAVALNVDATLSDLALVVPGFPGPVTAKGTLRDTGAAYAVDLATTAPGGTRAQITGTAAKTGATTDLRISGVSDAAIANPFLRVRSIEGPVNVDLRMQGKPGLEALSGRVSLPNARLSDPKLGLRVDGLAATADLDRGRITVQAAGEVQGGGRLTVSGPVDLRGGDPSLDLTVRLDGVVLRDPNLYQTTADGTVTVTGRAAAGPLVSGRVSLSDTEIRIPSTGLGGATAIPEIRHVRDRAPVRATRAKAGLLPFPSADSRIAGMSGPAATPPANPARLDLTIDAPNQVFVRGRGVDAEMGGQIRLTGRANNVIPVGQLELIRGRVDLLGKRFVLSEGLIELQGSLVPVIRLVAQTEQDGFVTLVIIDGEARNPDITFESSPDLPQEEVLSHLLFGRGLDTITPLQAAQLANALAVLAGKGGEGIVGRIRNSVGLDDLDLATDEQGNVSVRAGKYLTKNLYTDVAVDDQGKSKINLNLDVSKSLTARGSVASDGDSTIGLFYERDY